MDLALSAFMFYMEQAQMALVSDIAVTCFGPGMQPTIAYVTNSAERHENVSSHIISVVNNLKLQRHSMKIL